LDSALAHVLSKWLTGANPCDRGIHICGIRDIGFDVYPAEFVGEVGPIDHVQNRNPGPFFGQRLTVNPAQSNRTACYNANFVCHTRHLFSFAANWFER
jgi:hypothetical protein